MWSCKLCLEILRRPHACALVVVNFWWRGKENKDSGCIFKCSSRSGCGGGGVDTTCGWRCDIIVVVVVVIDDGPDSSVALTTAMVVFVVGIRLPCGVSVCLSAAVRHTQAHPLARTRGNTNEDISLGNASHRRTPRFFLPLAFPCASCV